MHDIDVSYPVCDGEGIPGEFVMYRPREEYYVLQQSWQRGLILSTRVAAGPFASRKEAVQEAKRMRERDG